MRLRNRQVMHVTSETMTSRSFHFHSEDDYNTSFEGLSSLHRGHSILFCCSKKLLADTAKPRSLYSLKCSSCRMIGWENPSFWSRECLANCKGTDPCSSSF